MVANISKSEMDEILELGGKAVSLLSEERQK